MAFLTFVNGQVLQAADMNTLSQQTVSTVTTAGRPTTPATGQPIHDTTVGAPFYWSGSQWVPQDHLRVRNVGASLTGTAPSAATTRWQMQAATIVVTVNAFTVAQVNFPSTFSGGVLTVVATIGDPQGVTGVVVDDVTTSGFLVVIPGAANSLQRINYIALGW